MSNRGLYIHIPFCKQKCNYCDFNSGPYREKDLDQYVQWLEQEAYLYEKAYGKIAIETVFIGGGTPTVLEKRHIESIGRTLAAHFQMAMCKEFTFEANPESVTKEKLEAFRAIGANRVSLGLQTANDTELMAISRIHDWQMFLDAFRTARQSGFDNINIDLMIGLPGQTKRSYLSSLEKVLALKPEHLSTYGLILEEGTPLEKMVSQGVVDVLEPNAERQVYHDSKALMEAQGYQLYEISNFSKAGYACQHNLKYWLCEEYVGLGVGAHGYLMGKRYENAGTKEAYGKMLSSGERPIIETELIAGIELEKEYVMLGLRMAEGISIPLYEQRFKRNPVDVFKEAIEKWQNQGLLVVEREKIKLTDYGMDVSNAIIIDFLEQLDRG